MSSLHCKFQKVLVNGISVPRIYELLLPLRKCQSADLYFLGGEVGERFFYDVFAPTKAKGIRFPMLRNVEIFKTKYKILRRSEQNYRKKLFGAPDSVV